jgi:hypothetical protein
MGCNSSSVFGPSNNYLKFQGGDLIAVEGANTVERLLLSDLRIPYKQYVKSRIILKPGQINYLLNHLGLGDNATFLAIKAVYNPQSINPEDNYITWNYFDDFSRLYSMGQLMVLSGNPTNRVKQIYLTNPNTNYSVVLDVIAAVVDDEYSFFNDTINQVGLSFTNLTLGSIETHIPNDSIVIWDNNIPRNPLAYIILENIASISRVGKLLILDDVSVGRLYLDFVTEYDARQSNSIINYVMENADVIIQNLDPLPDTTSPIIYFYSNVGNTASGWTISSFGGTQSPANTSMGLTFSTYIQMGTYSAYTKSQILDMTVNSVSDNRDGNIIISDTDLVLYDSMNIASSAIISTGSYSITFNVSDIAGNTVDTDIKFNIYVI